MEKLLYQSGSLSSRTAFVLTNTHQIFVWVFSGMGFSENINGRTFYSPSIALTFSSNICIIPEPLLPSRACFRLYRQDKSNKNFSTVKIFFKILFSFRKNNYFCKPKIGLKKSVNLYQDLNKKCKLFLGRVRFRLKLKIR
jgi:hypothetical protein